MASNILESIIFPNTELPSFEETFEDEDVNKLVFPNDNMIYIFKMEDLAEPSVIGSSMHVVRRYMHIPSGNFMAVKQIYIPFSQYLDETKEKRLRKLNLEIHTHREIANSPYIVDFYGLCLYDGCALLCMELMDVSLHGLVTSCYKSGKNIPEDLLGYTAVSILEALKVCKSKGIIHRDIKPENILIKKSGEIKLADFGESRFVGESQKVTTIAAGTICYWPPERLHTEGTKYDIRSDIWSFGLTLAEMAYGKYPIVHADGSDIDFQTVITLQNRILEAKADEIINRCVRSRYSEDLCEFIRLCLQKLEDRANLKELIETGLYKRFQTRNTKWVSKLILEALDEYDFTNDPNHYYGMPPIRISPTAKIKPQSLWARIVEFISAKKRYFIFGLIILLAIISVVVFFVTRKPTNQDGGTTTINNYYSTTHPPNINSTLSSSTTSSSTPAMPCPNQYWIHSNSTNKCYFVGLDSLSWDNSLIECQNKKPGATLVSIHSLYENQQLIDRYNSLDDTEHYLLHIGLREYNWTDGSDFDFSLLSHYQNNDGSCAYIAPTVYDPNEQETGYGHWYNIDCNSTNGNQSFGYICEWQLTSSSSTQSTFCAMMVGFTIIATMVGFTMTLV